MTAEPNGKGVRSTLDDDGSDARSTLTGQRVETSGSIPTPGKATERGSENSAQDRGGNLDRVAGGEGTTRAEIVRRGRKRMDAMIRRHGGRVQVGGER